MGVGQQSNAPIQLNPNAPRKPVAPLTLTNEDDLKAHAERATAERLLTSKDVMSGAHATEAMEMLVKTIPRGKMATTEEVAAAVSWLCSPQAAAVTGISFPVAGGEVW